MAAETRIPQILQAEIQGQNQIQIAENLGVSRMTIYRDRQTDLYQTLVNEFAETYVTKILEFANSDQATLALEGIKEMGRIIRTGITRQTKHTEDINIKASIDITEQRKKADALIKKMELSPNQFRVWEEHATSENEDLDK